jgi:tungstate transport system substrate-binding protein
VKYDLAMRFVDFVTGPEGQRIIAGYKANGEPVFFIYKK